MSRILEIGLSGWLVSAVVLLLGGGVILWRISTRRTQQSHIVAGGDVAGGDIVKNSQSANDRSDSSFDRRKTAQTDIVAGGDVAGGNIVKDSE